MLVLVCAGCFVCLACGLNCLLVIRLVSFGFECGPLLWWFGLTVGVVYIWFCVWVAYGRGGCCRDWRCWVLGVGGIVLVVSFEFVVV